MARAHCLLTPSVGEGWGMVITEANGVGTPAVGYAVPGIRDAIVPGRTGLLATPGSPAALADAAVALVSNRPAYEIVAGEARAGAARFSWDRRAHELLGFIEARLPDAIGPVDVGR